MLLFSCIYTEAHPLIFAKKPSDFVLEVFRSKHTNISQQVLEDGTFVEPKNDRLVYGSMTLIRTGIVGECGKALAKAATIATRFSHVRHQSKISPE